MDEPEVANVPAKRFAAIILAAGRGERAESPEGPKQYRMVGGRTVLRRTVDVFATHPAVGQVVVAIHADDADKAAVALQGTRPLPHLVIGGASRQASTLNALRALTRTSGQRVLIHDAARPFVDHALINRVLNATGSNQGAVPVLPVSDTLKRADSSRVITATVERAGLHAAQTPQGFPLDRILDAHEKAAREGRENFTDDAAIAEWAGLPVRIVEGSPDNIKLTWARDLLMADQRLSQPHLFPDVRTGNGYDVHPFAEGSSVWLCGVEISHSHRLAGHSDADVGLHALTDALLATCGEGDIGTHFPPSDERWRGAASSTFIAKAVRLVRERGGRITNADVTLIAEFPRIGPHREAMRATMAALLGTSIGRVSVKATTNERLGFVGRGEGIAAIATATVVYPGEVPQ